MKVGVLLGGLSKEREISLRSGKAVAAALRGKGYDVVEIDMGRDVALRLAQEKIDVAFLALHGRFGEDGTIQGLLEIMKIPYTGSGPLASGICLDKDLTKRLVSAAGVRTPQWRTVTDSEIGTIQKSPFSLPVIIKPNLEGSTLGMSIVRKAEELGPALQQAATFDKTIVIEEYISGTEVTVGVLRDKAGAVKVLPILEVAPKSGFYDYASKYTKGMTDYILPARISPAVTKELGETSLKIFFLLKLSGVPRLDFIVRDEKPYFLEVNTIPGMTETSLVPKMAAAQGISFEDLCEMILKGASS